MNQGMGMECPHEPRTNEGTDQPEGGSWLRETHTRGERQAWPWHPIWSALGDPARVGPELGRGVPGVTYQDSQREDPGGPS